MNKFIFCIFSIFIVNFSLASDLPNFAKLPLYSENGFIQMVVEIPAGTHYKLEYDYKTNRFPSDQINGSDRIIQFLPYLGNYGFIPSTLLDRERGGDGDALDVLVLSSFTPTGSVLEIIPIALLKLEDSGESDNKIIAIPAIKEHRIINATSYEELILNYPGITDIIKLWFTNYKGLSVVKFLDWKNEIAAQQELDKWSIVPDK